MILWEKSDCSPDWTELLSILADLAKLTEKCSKNCGLLPYVLVFIFFVLLAPYVCYHIFSRLGFWSGNLFSDCAFF